MCFSKQFFLQFLVNQEKLFVFLAKWLKNEQVLNKFTFNTVTFQVFFQGFYLDFKVLLLLLFLTLSIYFFSPMMAGLGITRQLTK